MSKENGIQLKSNIMRKASKFKS